MYEDNTPQFSFKSMALKILLIVLFVFIIIWLFPTKKYISNAIDSKLGTTPAAVLNNNINTMKSAALSYFNGNRLPSKEGDSKRLTLGDMLDKKLLVEFTDSKGKKCDVNKSYVEVTKKSNDYEIKTNLACTDKKAYVMSYIGNYDYCSNGMCEKKNLTNDVENVEKENKEVASDVENTKTTGGSWSNYGAWSNWTTTKISSSNSRQVEKTTKQVETGYKKIPSGTMQKTQNPKKVTVTNNGTSKVYYVCPADFDNGGYSETPSKCIDTVITYSSEPTYSNVIYYRYRDRSYTNS